MKRVGMMVLVLAGLLACDSSATVDDQAMQYGDPGEGAWSCKDESMQWDAAYTSPDGAKWGGTCSSVWECTNGRFKVSCTATQESVWDCECAPKESKGPRFLASGWCDLTPPERAERANVGCGWSIPVNGPIPPR